MKFIVCSAYQKELKYVTQRLKLANNEISVMPCACASANSDEQRAFINRKNELEKNGEIPMVLLPASCAGIDNSHCKHDDRNCSCSTLCLEQIIPTELLNYYIEKRYYIVSSGWLYNWERVVKRHWKFTKESASLFFNEAAVKILVIDTGVHDDYDKLLKEFSEFADLDYTVLPVGISYFENKVQNIINEERQRQITAELIKYKKETSKRLAEYSMIVDLIPTLSQINSEKLVIDKILEIFTILFAPEKVSYLKRNKEGGIVLDQSDNECLASNEFLELCDFKEDYTTTSDNRGFITKLKFSQKEYGYVLAENILHPEYLPRYLNLIQSLIPFFGLLIANSRQFEELVDINKALSKAKITITESEEKYRRLTENAPDIIYRMSIPDGNYEYVSPASEQIWGYSPHEFYKSPLLIKKTIHPDFAAYFQEEWDKLMAGKMSSYYEYKVITRNGEEKWMHQRNVLIKDENNKPIAIEGIVSDITESKRNETALKESNQTKDKFFSILAHDLKNPFTTIKGFSDLLIRNFDKYDEEKQKNFLSMINASMENLYKLLENLLLWSRTQRGVVTFKPENLNLNLIIETTIDLLTHAGVDKSIEIENQLSGTITLMADVDMISTVIRNLVSNAIKFTHAGGKIAIDANIENQMVKLAIKDNGVGISKEKQSGLFDISKNNSTHGTEDEPGTGLGLIICKEFVDMHGGEIWVDSEKGKGSVFYVKIPYKVS
jgi:PAS domain S-box-containing protein